MTELSCEEPPPVTTEVRRLRAEVVDLRVFLACALDELAAAKLSQNKPTTNQTRPMPDISQMTKSSYLKRADLGRGKLLTIRECVQETLKGDSGPEEKWILYFTEEEKGMVLNTTNAAIIAQFSGQRNSDDWGGIKIVAFDEPNVSMGGKLVGGIRVRAPRNQPAKPVPAAPAPKTTPPLAAEYDDDLADQDVPF